MSRGIPNTKQWTGTITGTSAVGGEPEITISSDLPDRTGDRVLPAGADISNFLKNPTLTWAHSRDEIPIGTITHIEIGPKSKIRWRWLEGDQFADRVRNAYGQNIVRASSIEFVPKLGGMQANDHGGYDYSAWELIGVSLVPTPANPDAVRTLRNLGLTPEKSGNKGLLADPVRYREWLWGKAKPEGTKEDDMQTPVDRDFAEMDVKHAAIAAVETAWDRVDPRGAMGVVVARPNFVAMDSNHIPRECRGGAGLSPAQRAVFDAQLLYARTGGAARAHQGNLSGEPEFDAGDMQRVLRNLAPAIARIAREAIEKHGGTIDRAIREAVTRARGRID